MADTERKPDDPHDLPGINSAAENTKGHKGVTTDAHDLPGIGTAEESSSDSDRPHAVMPSQPATEAKKQAKS